MFYVLSTLIVIDLGCFATSAIMGVMLEGGPSIKEHLAMGLVTTILLTFTHCLALFYLIGSGLDVKEALAKRPELLRKYAPWTRGLKRETFPWASTAMLMTIVAALMGAEVHSRLLMEAPPSEPPPLRGVGGWWIHLGCVLAALAVNLVAFRKELRAVRENRRGIDEINEALAAQEPAEAVAEDM